MNQESINWIQAIIAIAAALSLLLSIIIFINARKENKIKVKISHGFISKELIIKSFIDVDIINVGIKTVNIYNLSFELPNKKKFIFISEYVKYPFELNGGNKQIDHILLEKVVNSLHENGYYGKIIIKAIVKDATDKIFKSKKFKLDLDK